jgi:putative membrane protein
MKVVPMAHADLALLLHDGAFSWTTFSVHPSTVIGTTILTGLYLWGIGPARRRWHLHPVAAETWRIWCFLTGSALLLVTLNGPLHDLSDTYLFSAHMVQHLLLTLIIPPLWLLGLPAWLIRPLIRPRAVRSAARALTAPLVTFAVYNTVFIAWHLPPLYEATLEHHGLHIFEHLMFIASAVMLWWPAIAPLPELSRMGPPGRLFYLFTVGVPMSVVAALITMSGSVLYPWYAVQPRVPGLLHMTPLQDQRLGGLIMWVPGGLSWWVSISVIFYRWARREEALEEEARARPLLGGAGGRA